MNYEDIANILMELIPKKNVCILRKLQVFLQAEEYHTSDEFLSLLETKGFVFHKEVLHQILHGDWILIKKEETGVTSTNYKLETLIQFFDEHLQSNPLRDDQATRPYYLQPDIIKNYTIKTPLKNVALPWIQQGVIVHSLRANGHSISTKNIHRKSRLPVMTPIFQEVPNISFQNPYISMGHNFVQLQGEKLWRVLDDECYAKLAPHKDIIQIALRNFLKMIDGTEENSTELFTFAKLFSNNKKAKTHYNLGERIQFYYNKNNTCKEIKDGFVSGHIKRENAKENMKYWNEETPQLTMTRQMAVEISKQSGRSLLESLCAVLTALRIIETLLCSGYVINIIKYGRYMARKVTNPLQHGRYKNMQYRVAFLEWPRNPRQ